MGTAAAFSNNDLCLLAWKYDAKIKDCLGFAIYRTDVKTGERKPLPAWVGFKGQSNAQWQPKDTSVWPIQKFNWGDFTAARGGSYTYEIVPMIGHPDSLAEDNSNRLVTNQADISPEDGPFKVFFNRGILSTQSLAHQLPQGSGGGPNYMVLKDRIDQPGDPLRNSLAGQMIDALSLLLKRSKDEVGSCYCALYELNDVEMLKLLLDTPNLHIILSNTGKDDTENTPARQTLHEAGVDVTDRMLKGSHIGHNKFVVYVDQAGAPQAVLTGSTNWTDTGICAQSNNAIIIESPEVAKAYLDYWNCLKGEGNNQSAGFRQRNAQELPSIAIPSGGIDIRFAPCTKQQTKPSKSPQEPLDFKMVDDAICSAKKSILFLVFQPGSPSVVDVIAKCQEQNDALFVRGAATDPKVKEDFDVQLYHRTATQADTVVAVSAIKDQFAYWQKELLKSSPSAHAVIHDKIVVIDPLSEGCAVITGSHNLGYAASYGNDDNFVIIRGDKRLAQMYATHIMDVYDHYRWRWQLQEKGVDKAFNGLETDDSWQEKYFDPNDSAMKDLDIWF